jgi:CheY-like chemotaxis protein
VNTAANGASALEYLRKGTRPLAIIVDLHMPVMDGAALCEACRGDPKLRPIPLFLISGDRARGGEIAKKSGTGFLPKPVAIDSLLETIARVG